MTGKQRAYLRGLANNLEPLMQIGKERLTQGQIQQLQLLLEYHELVKINILRNADTDTKEAAEALRAATGAEIIQQIGNKLVLYRQSKEHQTIRLP
ncbi:MAG: ribosome assembly RNA-binding protein YhbY [Christensenellales bacterium]|jgi:RNA-binding protein